MGVCLSVSQFGSGALPWIVRVLNRYGPWCTFLSLGLPILIASLLAIRVHETGLNISPSSVVYVNDNIIEENSYGSTSFDQNQKHSK